MSTPSVDQRTTDKVDEGGHATAAGRAAQVDQVDQVDRVDDRRRAGRAIAAAAVASVALRLPLLRGPLTVDEAGAVVVARSWDEGLALYRDVFIDRPQGLVLAFQGWGDLFGLGSTSVRVLAMAAGVAAVIGTGIAAATLARSWRAGAIAAWLAAVIAASPAIEGYSANGELLAAGATTLAMAAAAVAVTGRRAWPMVLAGVLAALGAAIKQSGADVVVAVSVWLVVAGVCRWRPRRWLTRAWIGFTIGVAIVVGAVVLHATTLGWDQWAYAIIGFRLDARSLVAGGQWGRLAATTTIAVVLFGPAAVMVGRRIRALPRAARRTAWRPEHALVAAWVVAAGAAFAVGGNYHRHYWVQLAFPLAALAGVAVAGAEHAQQATDADGRPTQPEALPPLLVRMVALPIACSALLIVAPGLERDDRVDADAALAAWVAERRTTDADRLLPLCASVTYYAEAGEVPQLPYLWVDHVAAARGATDAVETVLAGPDRPRWVALHQPIDRCDRDGRLAAALERWYQPAARVSGVEVLEAKEPRG